MYKVVTRFPSYRTEGGIEYVLVLGRLPINTGSWVLYSHKDVYVGERLVHSIYTKPIGEALKDYEFREFEELTDYRTWPGLEDTYELEMTSDIEISIVGLKEYYGPDDIYELGEEYEEEYENHPRYEKIGNRHEWS